MAKVTIQALKREDKTSKAGKNYTSLSLLIDGTWHNGFGNKANAEWKQGDEVDLILTEKVFNGKTYHNFDMPGSRKAQENDIAEKLKWLHDKVLHLEKRVNALTEKPLDADKILPPEDAAKNLGEGAPF